MRAFPIHSNPGATGEQRPNRKIATSGAKDLARNAVIPQITLRRSERKPPRIVNEFYIWVSRLLLPSILMLNALLLLFSPVRTWERIVDSGRGIAYILIAFLLPMMILTSIGEGYGLIHWGKWYGEPPHLRKLSTGESVVFETGQFIVTLLIIVINASLAKSVGSTFHGRHTFTQSFIAISYGFTPLFLCRLLNASSEVSPWLSWSIGILLSIALLYHGVPLSMEPDPAHAFGLYTVTALMVLMTTGMLELITTFYLHGNFPKLEHAISALAARLPF